MMSLQSPAVYHIKTTLNQIIKERKTIADDLFLNFFTATIIPLC